MWDSERVRKQASEKSITMKICEGRGDVFDGDGFV